ncbi:hypothetical protein [Mannheimia granulomatis]|uniref:hypothetical protein n=1 Tax=Mannheimia granulomatis TaxID=85402 RepID=UPI00047D78AE|nr:hypothetical protein [Mannheimia granulomatis]QLB19388.1 hypothetical protein A6B41_07980 [Mannheimia granulomatis]
MKLNKKLILTLAAGIVLTACGGGSSGGAVSNPNPTPVSHKPAEINNDQEKNNIQEPASSKGQDKAQALPNSQNQQPSAQSDVIEKKPQPETIPSVKHASVASQPQEKKIDASFDKIGSVTLDKDAQTLTLNQFILVDKAGVQTKYDSVSGKKIIEEKETIVLPLANIGAEHKSADFIVRHSDDLFYGYYHDTNSKNLVDAADKFSRYFVVYDENRVNSNIAQDLTAVYSKKEGFIYGSNPQNKEFAARISKFGDISIKFENGKATGQVKDETSDLFTITGDTKQLIVTPTESNPIIAAVLTHNQKSYTQGMDKAVMDIKFVDSKSGASDQKYLIGEAKNDNWQAVMVSEKQQ